MTFSSEEWLMGKLQTVWIWNPGKFPSFCTGVMKMYNFGQIPSVILVDWAVFRTFLDFTKMWTRWNLESMFLKIVHQKGLFEAIKENPNFPSCREILDIYGQWLLTAGRRRPFTTSSIARSLRDLDNTALRTKICSVLKLMVYLGQV